MKTVIKIMYRFDIRIKNFVILSFIQDLRIYKIKKAAMFGLDARIALAIFGALSIITGAVLYSALDNADAIRDLNQINEIAKAYESFIIDTGKDLPIIATHYRHTKYLLEKPDNSYKNWIYIYLEQLKH